MSIGVVIPAAGQGQRMKAKVNKQYLNLAGRPVLAHTLQPFVEHPAVQEIVVVVKKSEIAYCKQAIIKKYFPDKGIKLVAGGETRRESVFAGLKVFSPAINSVIIHDGARPLLSRQLLGRVIESLKNYAAVAVGIKLKDTIKVIDERGFVLETPPRGKLAAIQTPQAFAYHLILEAHQKVPEDEPVTDDASLVEKMGQKVRIIPGSEENIKLTTPVDLLLAEEILRKRKESNEGRPWF